MTPRSFFRSAIVLFLVVTGMFYVASSFVVSKTIADAIRDPDEDVARRLSRIELVRVTPTGNEKNERFIFSVDPNKRKGDKKDRSAPSPRPNRQTDFSVRHFLSGAVQVFLFIAFLGIPVVIAYRFLVKPLREFPFVSPKILEALRSDDDEQKETAATIIARAMILSAERELQRIGEDDSRYDALFRDKEELEESLHFPIGRATAVNAVFERREEQAKQVARNFAKMAGLTVAISSSAMGDSIGMFFWKARLVHDTFRVYGFRPDTWTVLRIYAYVVFAVFLAASVEDLCELLDASELLGGFGVRVLQGVVGAAVILKGGQLTRAYLTKGVSEDSRKTALEQFRNSAAEELDLVRSSVENSLGSISKGRFSDDKDADSTQNGETEISEA